MMRIGLSILALVFLGIGGYYFLMPKERSPQKVLEMYLDLAFNIGSLEQKADLLRLTTGDLQAAIAGTNDDTFKEAYINDRYKLDSFSIVGQVAKTPREVEITYQLIYYEKPENGDFSTAPKLNTTNKVTILKVSDEWLIKDVTQNGLMIDFPLNEDSMIRPE